MAKIKDTDDVKQWWKQGPTTTRMHCSGKRHKVRPLWGNHMAISCKTKYTAIEILGIYSEEMKTWSSNDLLENIHSNLTYNNPQLPGNGYIVVYSGNGLLLSNQKAWTIDTYNSMNVSCRWTCKRKRKEKQGKRSINPHQTSDDHDFKIRGFKAPFVIVLCDTK